MLIMLVRSWWLTALRGEIGILFGVYSLVDDVFAAIAGAMEARPRRAGETAA
jgi:hypothetical protein